MYKAKLISLTILIVVFFSCERKSTLLEKDKELNECLKSLENTNKNVSTNEWSKEVLSLDSMTIKGKLIIMQKDSLFFLFGQPRETESTSMKNKQNNFFFLEKTLNFEQENIDLNLYFYGNTIFQEKNNWCIPQIIDFESTSIVINHPKVKLEKNLSVRTIQEIFPESSKLVRYGGNRWSGHIELRAMENGDSKWFLYFRLGKLKRMYLYVLPF